MRLHVTTHPARREVRDGLLPGFEVVFVEDDGRGLVANTLRTLRFAALDSPGSAWALRAEDDVVCHPGLAERMPELIASAPGDAALLGFCSLYDSPGTVGWRPLGRGWTFHTYLMAARKDWLDLLEDGVREASRYHPANRKREWDRFLTDWVERAGVPSYLYFPSLAQHVGETSLIGHTWGPGSQSPTYCLSGDPGRV